MTKRISIPTEEKKRITKFQSHLREVLKLYGWTPEEFGKRLGLSRQQVYNYMTGYSQLTKSQYLAMITVFSYDLEEIEKIFDDAKKAKLLEEEVKLKELKERLET